MVRVQSDTQSIEEGFQLIIGCIPLYGMMTARLKHQSIILTVVGLSSSSCQLHWREGGRVNGVKRDIYQWYCVLYSGNNCHVEGMVKCNPLG